ncbi:MAG: soluble NSF attachment family protein [Verrucomicrobiales bacterium]|nr:soluble NSF attachment family protein [Verrucomicrobiales bacterium]
MIPGGDPAVWLAEICRWPVDQTQLELFILPAAHSPVTPAALLVVTPEALMISAIPHALPCHRIFNKLAILSCTQLRHPIIKADEEILVPHDFAFLHPSLGLISFEKEDALTLEDLLKSPEISSRNWSMAHPGEPLSLGLQGVSVILPDDPESMIEQGQEDIGSENPDDLPKRAGESLLSNTLADLVNLPKDTFFKGVQKFTNFFPQTSLTPTWVNHLEDWAGRHISKLSSSQNREITRLLDLLKNDPEKGLKFALPLGDHGPQSRGSAGAGGGLGMRNVNFNLSSLFNSGGAIASWMLDPVDYAQLTGAYRSAANREIQLGRFRRAAYIFANLLGDFYSAANALRQGGLFREAAVLYEKKLKDPHAAAGCFREAGLTEDAIRLYEEIEDFEALGDLYAKLNRSEESRQSYEDAISHYLKSNHPKEAARLARQQFDDDQRALTIYRDAWPNSGEAAACLREEFKLLEELERHAEAYRRIVSLRDSPLPAPKSVVLCDQLTSLSRSYPAQSVVELAADTVRVVVSRNTGGGRSHSVELLNKLPKVEPNDLLLLRDARRFSERLTPARAPAAPGLTGKGKVKFVQSDAGSFSGGFSCFKAISGAGGIACIGGGADKSTFRLVFADYADGSHPGYFHCEDWPDYPEPNQKVPFIFNKSKNSGQPSRFILLGEWSVETLFGGIEPRTFNTAGSGSCVIENTMSQDGTVIGMCIAEDTGLLVKLSYAEDELYLRWFKDAGQMTSSHHVAMLPREEMDLIHIQVHMIATNEQVFFSIGNHLGRFYRGVVQWFELPSAVTDLAVTPPHTLLRLAVGMDRGAALVMGDAHWGQFEVFDDELEQARVTFTKSAKLIAVGLGRIECVSVKNMSVVPQFSSHEKQLIPVSVLSGINCDGFHIVSADEIVTYKLEQKL